MNWKEFNANAFHCFMLFQIRFKFIPSSLRCAFTKHFLVVETKKKKYITQNRHFITRVTYTSVDTLIINIVLAQ